MKDTWILVQPDSNKVTELSNQLNLHSKTLEFLISRGLTDISDIRKHLYPRYSDLYSPFLLSNIFPAVSTIRKAIKNKSIIGIFCDSDLDGITSLSILHNLLIKCGLNPYYRYPQKDETYGLTKEIVSDFASKGVSLIFTLDSGIRDLEEIDFAQSLGINVIVIDHHEQGVDLPNAIIVNPKQVNCSYPFQELAGVSVVFKFCCAVLISYLPSYGKYFLLLSREEDSYRYCVVKNGIIMKSGVSEDQKSIFTHIESTKDEIIILIIGSFSIDSELEDNYSVNIYSYSTFIQQVWMGQKPPSKRINLGNESRDVLEECTHNLIEAQLLSSPKIKNFIESTITHAAVGTIADVMPLLDENRTIVKLGLSQLHEKSDTIFQDILKSEYISGKAIAWKISPLLNTPGRFGRPELTVEFLLTDDRKRRNVLHSEIKSLNEKRKDIISTHFEKISKEIEVGKHWSNNITAVITSGIPVHFSGLLANRLADSLKKPALIFITPNQKIDNDSLTSGSGRSYDDYDFFACMDEQLESFERIGGHSQAFGFTLPFSNIEKFIREVDSKVILESINDSLLKVDISMTTNDLNMVFFKELSLVDPFGKESREPHILIKNISIESFRTMGGNKEHGKFLIKGNKELEIIGWRMAQEMETHYNKQQKIDIVAIPEINYFAGRIKPQLILIDIDCSSQQKNC